MDRPHRERACWVFDSFSPRHGFAVTAPADEKPAGGVAGKKHWRSGVWGGVIAFSSFPRLWFPCGKGVVASLAGGPTGAGRGVENFPDFSESAVSGASVPEGLSDPPRGLRHGKAGNRDQAQVFVTRIVSRANKG
jgi:hypothetical protein